MATPHAPTRHRRDDDGLTLIEMVVAMGVLMVVLLSSLSVFVTVMASQRTAEGTDRAIQLANHRIERIRQQDWRDIGFYNATYLAAIASTDYAVPPGESSVFIDPDVAPVAAADITPYEVTTAERTKYTIYTTITWGVHPILGGPIESGSTTEDLCADGTVDPVCQQFYSFKRIRVTVKWTSSGTSTPHNVVIETWISPEVGDEAPPHISSVGTEA